MKSDASKLPCLVALSALLIYLLTLNWGVSAYNLILTATVAGWEPQPMIGSPLTWLCTLPLKLWPFGGLPILLNCWSAITAALVLGLLVRSLELLLRVPEIPGSSIPRQRWLPALLGVVVCGLEYNFWQMATNATNEMVDVLMFAASIWCVLESRTDKHSNWLRAAVFIWGLGMTQNWMMMIVLPLFVLWVISRKSKRFLNWKFSLSLLGWGALGFSAYAVLPLVSGLKADLQGEPGGVWLASIKQTAHALGEIWEQCWQARKFVGIMLLIWYLLPPAALLTRLKDEQIKNKSTLDRMQIRILRGLRLVFLLLCAWLALDPRLGPRNMLQSELHASMPLLSFDYLDGLAAGYLLGNLLLSFQTSGRKLRIHRTDKMVARWIESVSYPLALAATLLLAAGLMARNLPAITLSHRLPLTRFGELALHSLPPGGGIVLSDFPDRLAVFQAAQAGDQSRRDWLPVDTRLLPLPSYRERLERQSPGLWLVSTNRHTLSSPQVLRLLDGLVRSNHVYYLHPSFGYFFEPFYLEPTGAVFELKRGAANQVESPSLSRELAAQNESFWNANLVFVSGLIDLGTNSLSELPRWLEGTMKLAPIGSKDLTLLQYWESVTLDSWGVALQRNGDLVAAQLRLEQSCKLDRENWIAQANLNCNTKLRSPDKTDSSGASPFADQMSGSVRLQSALNTYGPIDNPQLCFLEASIFFQSGLLRQSMQQLERAAALAPAKVEPRLSLVPLYVRCGFSDQALKTIKELRTQVNDQPDAARIQVTLSLLEADVLAAQTNQSSAGQIYQSLLKQYPSDMTLKDAVLEQFIGLGDFTNATAIISSMLDQNPEDLMAMLRQAKVLIKGGHTGEAIPIFSKILTITNFPMAQVDRAFAYLAVTNLKAAQDDFLEAQKKLPNPFVADLGLAEVALRQHDTNQAVQYYQQCLSCAPAGSSQWKSVHARLAELTLAKGRQ